MMISSVKRSSPNEDRADVPSVMEKTSRALDDIMAKGNAMD